MQVQIGSKQITCGKLKLSIMYTHLGCNDLFSTNTILILGDCVKKCHQNTETVRDQAHCSLPKKLLNQQLFCAWLTKSDHWIRSWERKSRGAWTQSWITLFPLRWNWNGKWYCAGPFDIYWAYFSGAIWGVSHLRVHFLSQDCVILACKCSHLWFLQ